MAPHFKVPLGALTVRFKVIPPKTEEAALSRWGVQPQWDNRRGRGGANVSRANEMTNNYAHITGYISSQQISFECNDLLASIHTSRRRYRPRELHYDFVRSHHLVVFRA